jgi:uncharacterized protein Yka (UPF0111/DUF47 family)
MIFIQSISNSSWQPHEPNTVLDKIVSADNCSLTTIGCGAVAQLEINHRTCSTPASEQQVEKLEINLEQKIEQVTAKIETVAESSGKQSEEIYQTVKDADKKIISIEDKVDDLKNTTNRQSEKVNHVIQKLNISIGNNSDDLLDKVNNVVHQIQAMKINLGHQIENATETSDKHADEINQKLDKKVQEINNNIETLENNMASLAQTVKDNIAGNIVLVFEHRVTICIQIKLRCLYK